MSKNNPILRPGQTAPFSAQYAEYGPRGGNLNHEVTVSKGETMPPSQGKGHTFRVADKSNNKSGRGK